VLVLSVRLGAWIKLIEKKTQPQRRAGPVEAARQYLPLVHTCRAPAVTIEAKDRSFRNPLMRVLWCPLASWIRTSSRSRVVVVSVRQERHHFV
jgi:hypothetical protein